MDEVFLRGERCRVICDYCGAKFGPGSRDRAKAWLVSHECEGRPTNEYRWIASVEEAREFGRAITGNMRKAKTLACAHCGASTRVARTAEQAEAWFLGHACS